MGKHNTYPGIDPVITHIIARLAERVTWKLGLTESYIQDIEQDLHITVDAKLRRLPAPVPYAVIQQIVKTRAFDIMRWHLRKCRTRQAEAFSANEPSMHDDGSDDEMGETVDLEAQNNTYRGLAPSWYLHRETSTDIAEALATLPNHLRLLADALEETEGNLTQAAQKRGLTEKKSRLMRQELKRRLQRILDDDF